MLCKICDLQRLRVCFHTLSSLDDYEPYCSESTAAHTSHQPADSSDDEDIYPVQRRPSKSHIDNCLNDAASLTEEFEDAESRDVDDELLVEAIKLYREVLALCPKGHPKRSKPLMALPRLLWMHHAIMDDQDLLHEAIDLEREGLSLCPKRYPLYASSCTNLAVSLKKLYRIDVQDGLMTEAINLEREVLALRHKGHPFRALACETLAASLWEHFQRTGDDSELAEVIGLEREALAQVRMAIQIAHFNVHTLLIC